MNRFRRKHRGLLHFMQSTMLILFLIFVSIIIFSAIDNEGYFYLTTMGKNLRTYVNAIKYEDGSSESVFNESNGTTAATDGSGLNLLLISQLDEGYIKELLTIYKEGSEGKFDSCSLHNSLSYFLGLHVNEVGFYAETQLPKSYIPIENKTVQWKKAYKDIAADDISLYRIDNSLHSKLPHNGLDNGVAQSYFQFENTTGVTKSLTNGAGNSGRTTGDKYFLPDLIATENSWLSNAARSNFPNVNPSENQCSAITSIVHNRGAAALVHSAFGITYATPTGAFVDTSKETEENYLKYATNFAEAYNNYSSAHTPDASIINYTSSAYGRWLAVAICAKTEGYYFSSDVSNVVTQVSVNSWNAIWAEDKVKNTTELKAKLAPKTMDLNKAIKETTGKSVSTSDTKRVYNTSSDYDDSPYFNRTSSKWGYIYHIENHTSEAYKNKYSDGSTPYVVEGLDIVNLGQQASVMILGEYIYANLLRLGGVAGVDSTNPSTYKTSLSNSETYVPGM